VQLFAVENGVGHDVLQHVGHEEERDQGAGFFGDAVLREFGAQLGHAEGHPAHLDGLMDHLQPASLTGGGRGGLTCDLAENIFTRHAFGA